MELGQKCLEGRIGSGGGLEEGERLLRVFDLPLPKVDRLDGWTQIDASRQLSFDQSRANLARRVPVGEGAEDEK